uniref:Uncharacterized protein n=1 Tax=Acrobeloides nanus TaxID=290746 RepID=A0A914CVC2_9BILA
MDETYIDKIVLACKYLKRDDNEPLGIRKIIPIFNSKDYVSVAKYFLLVERLCDTYADSCLSHISQDFQGKYTVEITAKEGIHYPRKICHRTELNWEPKVYVTGWSLLQGWCRIAAQYFDWVSHIPELNKLDEDDRVDVRRRLYFKWDLNQLWLMWMV